MKHNPEDLYVARDHRHRLVHLCSKHNDEIVTTLSLEEAHTLATALLAARTDIVLSPVEYRVARFGLDGAGAVCDYHGPFHDYNCTKCKEAR